MSITDELREFVESHLYLGAIALGGWKEAALDMIDRIDAELEDYIELPKDADGVPIRIGDKMLLLNGRNIVVDAIGSGLFVVWNPDDRHFDACVANVCHHAQPDSWERIIEDAVGNGFTDTDNAEYQRRLVERCKRLAGEVG